jgi:hypothetical protein
VSFGILLACLIPAGVTVAVGRHRRRGRIGGEWGLLREHERAMRLLGATIDGDT